MPRRTPPVVDKVKDRYSEKVLHIPTDLAIVVSTLLAVASAGLLVLIVIALAVIVALIIFRTD